MQQRPGYVRLPDLPGGGLAHPPLHGDVIAISTEDGVTAGEAFVLYDGATDWIRLTVH